MPLPEVASCDESLAIGRLVPAGAGIGSGMTEPADPGEGVFPDRPVGRVDTCALPHLRLHIVSDDMEAAMLAVTNVADVLGLPAKEAAARSPFGLIARIEDGLPIGALERVSRLLAPDDAHFKYRLVPKATYERRKATHRLSSQEGARLARLARVWSLALDVWQSEAEARDFLFRPHPMLEDGRPIDVVIRSEIGAELVLDILGRLKYGSAA